MSQGIENHVDWVVPTTPDDARHAAGPRRAPSNRAAQPRGADKRSVMDTLLGENNLAAFDVSGGDPYNATGRHLRR